MREEPTCRASKSEGKYEMDEGKGERTNLVGGLAETGGVDSDTEGGLDTGAESLGVT